MEKERLEFCIQRFDHYYDSMNNKSSVFLAIGTFVTGVLIATFHQYLPDRSLPPVLIILLYLAIASGLLSMIIIVLSVIPFTKSSNNSLLFFESIAKKNLKEFIDASQNLSQELEIQDFREQAHALSQGLRKKSKLMKYSGILLILQFILLFPIVYHLLTN